MITNLKSAANTPAIHPLAADHASAYRDLDGPLHDLKNMVVLLGAVIDDSLGTSKGRENGSITLSVTEDQFDSLHFAARNVRDMMAELLKDYDADFEIPAAVA
jgi:hypothetical protein